VLYQLSYLAATPILAPRRPPAMALRPHRSPLCPLTVRGGDALSDQAPSGERLFVFRRGPEFVEQLALVYDRLAWVRRFGSTL
jgi:hypothetical protein